MRPTLHSLRLAVCGGAFALSAPALAQDFVNPPLEMDQAGVFCPFDAAGTAPAPDTESGYILLMDHDRPVDIETRIVPAEIGLSFGIRIRQTPGDVVQDFTMRVIHPPIGPRGVTVERWNAGIGFDFGPRLFTFEFPRELQTGEWTFEVMQGEDVLLRQSFTVVPPQEAQWVIDTCLAPSMLS